MNQVGRITRPEAGDAAEAATYTGNRALMLEELLIFEMGLEDGCGVDFEDPSPRWRGEGEAAQQPKGEGDTNWL